MADINIDDLLDDLHELHHRHEVTTTTPQKHFPSVPSSSNADWSASSVGQYSPHPPHRPNPGQNPNSRFVRADGSTSPRTSPTSKSTATTTTLSSSSSKALLSSSNTDPEQNLDEWLDSLTVSSPTIHRPSNTSSYSKSNAIDAAALTQSPSGKTQQFPSSPFSKISTHSSPSIFKIDTSSSSYTPSCSYNNINSYSQFDGNQSNTGSSSNTSENVVQKLQPMKSHRSSELDNSWDEDDDDQSLSDSSHSNGIGSFSLASLSNTRFTVESSQNHQQPTTSAVGASSLTAATAISNNSINSNSNSNSSATINPKQRCCQVVLGDALTQRGLRTSSFSPCVCDALLCSQCNFKVLFFPRMRWQSSADYLFFRNNMPNTEKLSTRLERSEQSGAYCCQCQCASVLASEGKRLLTIGSAQDPQWICTGHLSTSSSF
jgi:hypothetical protein